MTEIKFGVIKATHSLPARDLLRVPHRNNVLIVSSPAFGPSTYSNNLEKLQGNFSCLPKYSQMSFREPTTSESVSASAYNFGEMAKPQIFDKRWLQLGRIVRTSEGVFVNPPKDEQGNPITDEQTLKSHLNDVKTVNGIYLANNDFGFAPYETFERGIQEGGKFAEGGLARVLEHTEGKVAENLKVISSADHYKRGVDVWGFDKVKEPVLTVATLDSDRNVDGGRLDVGGYWCGDYGGYVFGVFHTAEGGAPKISG